VIPSGHRTYLEAKAKGESSMSGKAGAVKPPSRLPAETRMAWRRLDCLNLSARTLNTAGPDTVGNIRGPHDNWQEVQARR
jgi:hypothetical protein